MVELKTQYPFVNGNGEVHNDLIKHYAEDENGVKYFIIQNETGIKYESAVDVYPCRFTYTATSEVIPEREDNGDVAKETEQKLSELLDKSQIL